jgi:hypothetical protein
MFVVRRAARVSYFGQTPRPFRERKLNPLAFSWRTSLFAADNINGLLSIGLLPPGNGPRGAVEGLRGAR